MFFKIKKSVAALVVLLLIAGVFAGCFASGVASSTTTPSSAAESEDGERQSVASPSLFLKTSGAFVVTAGGDKVFLRGVNAGGLCAVEFWMNGFERDNENGIRDTYTVTQTFIERFGIAKTKELWAEYKKNWWTDADFAACADMGFNVIRLPFTYMDVDFDAVVNIDDAGREYDFEFLDEFIAGAAKHGLYVVLDLHGAYGSQNGKDHSGQVKSPEDVDFYSNEKYISLTAELWKAIAKRYKNEAAVAGYDILNEPAETTGSGTLTTETRHFKVFDRIYKAIRSVDEEHIVIFESCWTGNDLPRPESYGWENCMYSFHHYTGASGVGQLETHAASMLERVEDITSKNFGVPLYMGEFTCYNDVEHWQYTLALFNAAGLHWTSWTYKINSNYGGWGIYRVNSSKGKINAYEDSEKTLKEKFALLKTEKGVAFEFYEGKTLADVLSEYAALPYDEGLIEGEYLISVGDYGYLKNGVLQGTTYQAAVSDSLCYFKVAKEDYGKITICYSPDQTKNNYLSYYQYNGNWTVGLIRNTNGNEFLPVLTFDGYKLLNNTAHKYLRYNGVTGKFSCDTLNISDATTFAFSK